MEFPRMQPRGSTVPTVSAPTRNKYLMYSNATIKARRRISRRAISRERRQSSLVGILPEVAGHFSAKPI